MPAVSARQLALKEAVQKAHEELDFLQAEEDLLIRRFYAEGGLRSDGLDEDHSSDADLSDLSSLSSLSLSSITALSDASDHPFPDVELQVENSLHLRLRQISERRIALLKDLQLWLEGLSETRVFFPNNPVPKLSQLHLVLHQYRAENPKNFRRNLRVLPATFDVLHTKIQDHPVFSSPGSLRPQFPVEHQLAIALYRFGHNGNGASVESIGQWAGVSAGSMVNSTRRVMRAFLDLHDEIMCDITPTEKEEAKQAVEDLSCAGWRDGYCMVDGTTIPLEWKPGLHGEGYFDRKSSYSLNLQLISLPNLRIIDYGLGHCGSAHDSTCFKDTKTAKETATRFRPGEWIWADSAYASETWTITPYKKPLADLRENKTFNYWVSRVRVRSEHAVGYLKGRFMSLRGLRQQIGSKRDHILAIEWVRVCVLIHTMVQRIEGREEDREFRDACIEDGLYQSDSGQRQPVGDTRAGGRRLNPGQQWRETVKARLFASGVTS